MEHLSDFEHKILNARRPVRVDDTEMLTVAGQQGVWLNKREVDSWRGDLHINQYRINEDSNPKVIHKKSDKKLDYVQELRVKYLRPETPQRSGDIVVEEGADFQAKPAPPVIIRQECCRPATPSSVVLREEPPQPPMPEGPKYIRLPGKCLPPPARKVIIERMAPAPPKPQNVRVERWLPFKDTERRVVYKKAQPVQRQADPRNVIIQWDAPKVEVHQRTEHLGVTRMNTEEYRRRYGRDLKRASEFPAELRDLRPTSDVGTLWADNKHRPSVKLVGDLHALALVDLDREGLGHYKDQLVRAGVIGGSRRSRGHSHVSSSGYAQAVPAYYPAY